MVAHTRDRDSTIPPVSGRWTVSRKAELLGKIARGEITEAQALSRYGVTADELEGWGRRFARWGEKGLRQTTLQETR
jgi:hypothetical protein